MVAAVPFCRYIAKHSVLHYARVQNKPAGTYVVVSPPPGAMGLRHGVASCDAVLAHQENISANTSG